MRYPPAFTIAPGVSWVYRSAALLIAIILIALCAVSLRANGQFSLNDGLWMALAAFASIWLLRDAYAGPQGSLHDAQGRLHYAQGAWHWQHGDQQITGTCALHLDLQNYMLVSFKAHPMHNKPFLKTTQWFHLEGSHADTAVNPGAWLALRRALVCPAHADHAEQAA